MQTEILVGKSGLVLGIETDCITGKKTQRIYGYEIIPAKETEMKMPIFQLCGGPTSYESFYIDEHVIDDFRDPFAKYWVACMGTKDRWNTLEIDAGSMRYALGIPPDHSARGFIYHGFKNVKLIFRRKKFLIKWWWTNSKTGTKLWYYYHNKLLREKLK